MNTLRSRIAAIGLFMVLPIYLKAQSAGVNPKTPNTASIRVDKSQKLVLVPGQEFTFAFTLNSPPTSYEGWSSISYLFQMIEPSQIVGAAEMDGRWPPQENVSEYLGSLPVNYGQTFYPISVPIKHNMLPGKWKLTKLTIGGKHSQTTILIPDNITFEIPQIPPILIRIQTPNNVKAGNLFTVKIDIDGYPKNLHERCGFGLYGVLQPIGSNGQFNPNDYAQQIRLKTVELKSNSKNYELSSSIDPDQPIGLYQGELSIVGNVDPPPDVLGEYNMLEESCPRAPKLEGDIRFEFKIESANLVTPTIVSVIINPSQIELLRGEADQLKVKAERLNQQLNAGNTSVNKTILLSCLKEAMSDLDSTEVAYKERGAEPSSTKVVNVFFDDLRVNYGEALKILSNSSARTQQNSPRLERVSAALGSPSPRLDRASIAVLTSILHVAKAYELIASSKTFYFNLTVYSEPQGAEISYRQRGGEYHPLDHETDWTIENLVRAVYLIRLQKPGYEDKEVQFDAIDSPDPSIVIRLDHKQGAR